MKRSLTLRLRLQLMAVAVTVATMLLAAYSGWSFYNTSMDQRLTTTRTFVEQAVGIAKKYADQAQPGGITADEAKAKAIADIRAMRYDGSEYLFITDMGPKMVMHPMKPEMEGKDLSDYKDPTGKQLFNEMVATVKAKGAGYVDYQWPKPNQKEPEPKRSFVGGYTPWGWVIGSGVYTTQVRTSAVNFATISLVVGALCGLGVFLYVRSLAGSLQRRLADVDRSLQAIAQGDLTVELRSDREDEIGRLIRSVNMTRDGLRNVVSQVRGSTDCIAGASGEIATGNADLSRRTEQTSSNLQQTANSIEQLTSAVRHSADAAAQANQLAHSASTVAERGGSVVSQVVSTMDEINAASKKISDIIGVIDGIAFQTNILALNAAVESARAGEQGRGFAVVAGEVRTLAQRSAEAAKEIKSLIGASVASVESGSRLVADAGTTMREIVESVRRVSDIVGEISAATSEQSSGIGQVNGAVTQLDHMTQQNAALVEQSAAAAESLKDQAQRLAGVVQTFRLAEA